MGPTEKTPHIDRKKTRSQQSLTVELVLLFATRTPDVLATIVATRLANLLAMPNGYTCSRSERRYGLQISGLAARPRPTERATEECSFLISDRVFAEGSPSSPRGALRDRPQTPLEVVPARKQKRNATRVRALAASPTL